MAGLRRKERVDRGIKVRSESLYVLGSPRAMLYVIAPRVALVAILLILPLVASPYWKTVVLSACLYALLAISFDFLANYAGLLCLGGAFFFGTGAYGAGYLSAELGLPLAVSLAGATVLGALACTVLLLPCLRLRGIYFAVVTLMYPLLAQRLIAAENILGGTDGTIGIEEISSPVVRPYLVVAVLLLALFGLRRYAAEAPGLVLRAVKDNDQAVRAAGISVAWCRAQAVFLSALLGCFAGACYAHVYGSVGPSAFALELSILPIAATVIGGAGTLVGPVVGSLILLPLGEELREFGSLRIAIFALVLTLVTVLRSDGLIQYVTRKYQQFERWVDV